MGCRRYGVRVPGTLASAKSYRPDGRHGAPKAKASEPVKGSRQSPASFEVLPEPQPRVDNCESVI
jgi:hypothetical protein